MSSFPTLLYTLAERVSPAARRWRGGKIVALKAKGSPFWDCTICLERAGELSQAADHLGEHGIYELHVDTWSCEIRTGYRGEILRGRSKANTETNSRQEKPA